MKSKKTKKEKSSNQESIEHRILEKAKKYTKSATLNDTNNDTNCDEDNQHLNQLESHTTISKKRKKKFTSSEEKDEIGNEDQIKDEEKDSAQKVLNKVKKLKEIKRKKAAKERKKSKAAKIDANQNKESTDSNIRMINSIKYLHQWKHNRNEWKFKKVHQIWLMKNWSNKTRVNDCDFDLFIEYIEGMHNQSVARKRLLTEAQTFMEKYDQLECQESDSCCYSRARQIIQCLV